MEVESANIFTTFGFVHNKLRDEYYNVILPREIGFTKETLDSLAPHFIIIQEYCKIPPITKDILVDIFYTGISSRKNSDARDFIIDLAKGYWNRYNCIECTDKSITVDPNVGEKLIRMVLKYYPEFYSGWSELEYILRIKTTNVSVVSDISKKEYIEVLQTAIRIGKKIGKNVSYLEYYYSESKLPSQDISHEATIVYYDNRSELQCSDYKDMYPVSSLPENEIKNQRATGAFK